MEEQVVDRELVRLGLDAFQQILESLQRRLAEAGASHLPDSGLATAAMLAMVERLAYFTSSRDLDFSDEAVVDVLDDDVASRGVRRPCQSTPSSSVEAELNQPPVPFTQAIRGAGHLTVAGLATQLLDGFDHEEHSPHARVTGRQSAAVGVRRQRAADRAALPSSTNGPPSPLPQKPSASSESSTIDVNAS